MESAVVALDKSLFFDNTTKFPKNTCLDFISYKDFVLEITATVFD